MRNKEKVFGILIAIFVICIILVLLELFVIGINFVNGTVSPYSIWIMGALVIILIVDSLAYFIYKKKMS